MWTELPNRIMRCCYEQTVTRLRKDADQLRRFQTRVSGAPEDRSLSMTVVKNLSEVDAQV